MRGKSKAFIPKYIVRLPKDAVSPTGSIYKTHDIVTQDRVLWSNNGSNHILYSTQPFIVSAMIKGKVKKFEAKVVKSRGV